MTLLLDVGNSAIKWTKLSADGALAAVHSQLHLGVTDIAAQLADQWRHKVVADAAVVACNVAGPEVVAAVEEAAHALGLRAVRWLGSQGRFVGAIVLVSRYRNPAQLGADRWHGMLGACAVSNIRGLDNAFIVVNAGTATTVDCVNVAVDGKAPFTGTFVGGVIAPGVHLMLESLSTSTAGLPRADVSHSRAADFPDNTDDAIGTGVLDAQLGLIDRVWHRFAEHLRVEPRVIITGGHAEAISARLPMACTIEDNLVLRGLALRAQSDLHKGSVKQSA